MSNERARQIAGEQAADERYRDALRRDDERAHHVQIQGPANSQWTRTGVPRTPALPTGELVGRVALHHPSDLVDGSEFYIGPRHLAEDGLTVFSWTAPIASTFFRGREDHELCADVAVTRTLIRRGERIVDYFDEHLSDPRLHQPFARRALTLPQAPSRRPIRGKMRPRSVNPTPEAAQPTTESPRPVEANSASRARVPQPVSPRHSSEAEARIRTGRPALRAEPAVQAAITAARRERLSSVLATLQPDQYELVTRDPSTPLVIQGHPGTGKTIVAAHRAAYLVHKDTPAERRRHRVLLVGPTEHYVKHIKGVLADLADSGTAQATSLPDLMLNLRDLSDPTDGSLPTNYRDVDVELGLLAEQATHLLRTAHLLPRNVKHAAGVAAVYTALRANQAGPRPVTRDHDWAAYLTALPPLPEAQRMRRFLPLLARCSLSIRPRHTNLFDHIIVDEAQDVTPLEWKLLDDLNSGESWTLLGDMNQRRSDWSCHTWDQVAETLELPDGPGSLRIEQVDRGYRTTSAIMQFAGKLLPRGERTVESLQAGGVPPRIESARASDLHTRAATEALRLLDNHSDGSVAIIGTNYRESARALRKRGFTTDPADQRRLVHGWQRIWVLDAQDARGLEFDAVVVVEPSSFPTTLGRHGLLYTSLTRANRELVVVHSSPLPAGLRRHQSPSPRKAS
jgi:DNA helicase II / ATP-dependent DNA helicase PcrA